MITSSFCGSVSKTGCYPGLIRINFLLQELRRYYETDVLPYLTKNYAGKFASGITALKTLGENLYGKSQSEIQSYLKSWTDNLASQGRQLQLLELTTLTDILKNAGFDTTNLLNVIDGTVTENFENINDLKALDGRFSKYKYIATSNLPGASKSAFYVPNDIPYVAIYIKDGSIRNAVNGLRAVGTEQTILNWTIGIPIMVSDTESSLDIGGGTSSNATGSGVTTAVETDDCPCEEVVRDIKLYLRKTKGNERDVPIEVPYIKTICEGTNNTKTVRINCVDEVGRIIEEFNKRNNYNPQGAM